MYETKTIGELEELASNLRFQLALHPDCELERIQLQECEKWIELSRAGEKRSVAAHS
jgi:hypothetical protein